MICARLFSSRLPQICLAQSAVRLGAPAVLSAGTRTGFTPTSCWRCAESPVPAGEQAEGGRGAVHQRPGLAQLCSVRWQADHRCQQRPARAVPDATLERAADNAQLLMAVKSLARLYVLLTLLLGVSCRSEPGIVARRGPAHRAAAVRARLRIAMCIATPPDAQCTCTSVKHERSSTAARQHGRL